MNLERHTIYHKVVYNGKIVLMDYINNKKDEFKYACLRIIDNGADGYVICPNGDIYEVTQKSKKAKKIDKVIGIN